ncbi:hypothetical protein [Pseudomonas syringae]|uniref:hypothetical protein n=1 Tax=Pseudomonas syringae TaxID=317 RepID=UPI0023F98666|nr:hypothetical protein [Pseudomonas syringae]MDF5774054.1 hypothetical protein [Pseudomonas syringae pv. syringae]
MAILMLLGAGASFGSEPRREVVTPPLGAGLFKALEALGGEASNVPDEIKEVFRDDFETGMALYFEKHSDRMIKFNRELSYFLSGFSPSDSSSYVQLLSEFGRRNIVFSSLNYDVMLEEAAAKIGLGFSYDYSRVYGSIRIIKPHGSVNVWPALPGFSVKNNTISLNTCRTFIDGPVELLTRDAVRARCLEESDLYPSIAMYAKGKSVSICPRFTEEQQNNFALACRRASKIITLGVRVVPEDNHIWQPIQKSAAELIYFGDHNDKPALDAWSYNYGKKNVKYVEGYFEQCLSFMKSEI